MSNKTETPHQAETPGLDREAMARNIDPSAYTWTILADVNRESWIYRSFVERWERARQSRRHPGRDCRQGAGEVEALRAAIETLRRAYWDDDVINGPEIAGALSNFFKEVDAVLPAQSGSAPVGEGDVIEALRAIVRFCDDPQPAPYVSLAVGLVGLLPAARAALDSIPAVEPTP